MYLFYIIFLLFPLFYTKISTKSGGIAHIVAFQYFKVSENVHTKYNRITIGVPISVIIFKLKLEWTLNKRMLKKGVKSSKNTKYLYMINMY